VKIEIPMRRLSEFLAVLEKISDKRGVVYLNEYNRRTLHELYQLLLEVIEEIEEKEE